jgi:hypothetical protein
MSDTANTFFPTLPPHTCNRITSVNGAAPLSVLKILKDNTNFGTYTDHTITGQLVTVSLVVSNAKIESSILNMDDYKKNIKMELCRMMAEEMYKKDLFSFTVADDLPMDAKTFFARMFVTPGAQTQIIRQMLANK